jgi:integrase
MSGLDRCLIRSADGGVGPLLRLGVPLLDDYLEFVSGRCSRNTVLATAFDLTVFFRVVAKPPGAVTTADVLGFITAQRTGAGAVGLRVVDGFGGVSTRTVRRRLSSVSGLFAYLHARGDIQRNPVPRGLPTRRERQRPHQGVPLVRTTRTLPRILTPAEVDALLGALRTHRDRAMVLAMVLGGLRRCEVLGLRLGSGSTRSRHARPGPAPPPGPSRPPAAGSGRCAAARGRSRASARPGGARRQGFHRSRKQKVAVRGVAPSTPGTPDRFRLRQVARTRDIWSRR